MLGIALAGGGAKGGAHAGVLAALEEHRLKPSVITGTSSGSIIAALYACGYSPGEIKCILGQFVNGHNESCGTCSCSQKIQTLIDFDYPGIFKMLLNGLFLKYPALQGFLKGEKLHRMLAGLFLEKGVINISDVKMPLAMPAVDLMSGKTVYFSNIEFAPGVITDVPLASAVSASCAFPSVFRPRKLGNMLMVDGGLTDNLPVEILPSLGADFTMAVELGVQKDFSRANHKNFINIADRCIDILRIDVEQTHSDQIGYLLNIGITDTSLLELKNLLYCCKKGYDACLAEIDSIKAALQASSALQAKN